MFSTAVITSKSGASKEELDGWKEELDAWDGRMLDSLKSHIVYGLSVPTSI